MKPEKKEPLASMKVRATKTGYFGDGMNGPIIRTAGDVFIITPRQVVISDPKSGKVVMESGEPKMRTLSVEEQFSENWMEAVPIDVPERVSSAQQVVNRDIRELTNVPFAAQ